MRSVLSRLGAMLISVKWPLAHVRVCALRLWADPPTHRARFTSGGVTRGKNEIHLRMRFNRSIPPSFERKSSVEQPRLFKLFERERIGDAYGVICPPDRR